MGKKVSRRQFLTYTIGSTAGFLGATMLYPMVRFAVDPMLKHGEDEKYFPALEVADITDIPKAVEFEVEIHDGWYQPKEGRNMTAWVFRLDGEIVAFSPICKHLGCTVSYEANPQFKEQFFCPCHFGRYYKDGRNVPGTPPSAPLDRYKTKIENGRLWIGPVQQA